MNIENCTEEYWRRGRVVYAAPLERVCTSDPSTESSNLSVAAMVDELYRVQHSLENCWAGNRWGSGPPSTAGLGVIALCRQPVYLLATGE